MRSNLYIITMWRNKSGQSLIEATIALAIGGILIGSATIVVVSILHSDTSNNFSRNAVDLNNALLSEVRVIANSNWSDLDNLPRGSGSHFHIDASSSNLTILLGDETVVIEGLPEYTRYFFIENVSRDSSNNIVLTGGVNDPLTLKVVSYVGWSRGTDSPSLTMSDYVTRWRNGVFHQTDWSGGVLEGPFIDSGDGYSSSNGLETTEYGIRLEGL
jgi:hypothetical protein